MLESERAEKKREKDNERKSDTGVNKKQEDNKQVIEVFKKLKNKDMELFKEIPPVYSSYYKDKINEYFYNFE